MDFHDIRDRLVLAALPHAVFEGWAPRTLETAARELDLDATMAERAFMAGPSAAVEHFVDLADRLMEQDVAGLDLAAMRLPDRVFALLDCRFRRWAPHREAIRRALAVLALNPLTAARATARTVDAVWRVAGDNSADFSWYTRRATLGAVYSAAMLFWLDDESDDCVETQAFLRRRLADVGRVTSLRKRAQAWLGDCAKGVGMPRGI